MHQNLYDKTFSQNMGIESDECITPMTPFKKRILYKVVEFEALLDSSNISIKEMI